MYGSDVFSENSSVCRALMFSGEYIEKNGLAYGAYSGVKGLVKEFKSGSRNKIETKYMNDNPIKGYTMSKFSDFLNQCPKIKFKSMNK